MIEDSLNKNDGTGNTVPDPVGQIPDPQPESALVGSLEHDKASMLNRYHALPKKLLPPNAIDLEKVILGALLIDRQAVEIMPILFPEMFYLEKHRILFNAIAKLYEEDSAIDLLTVSEKLKASGEIGFVTEFYMVQLTQLVASAAHIEHHARIVMQKYVLREAIIIGNQIVEESYKNDPDIFDVMDYVQDRFSTIHERISMNAKMQTMSLAEQAIQTREKTLSGDLTYLPTSFYPLDNHLNGGFMGSELTILAGRPGMGKTSVALIFAKKFSLFRQFKGLFVSLEMPKRQVVNKLGAETLGIKYNRLKRLDLLSPEEFNKVVNFYDWFEKNSPIQVDDTLTTIPAIANYLEKNRPEYLMVDYLQLLELDSRIAKKAGNREQEVSYFSRSLKKLAKLYDIPVIALSQLGRKPDDRPGNRPRLADLRESGAIEQDADNIVFIVRPAYYRDKENTPDIEQGNTIIDFAKGRDLGTAVWYAHIDMVGLDMFENFKFDIGVSSLPLPDSE